MIRVLLGAFLIAHGLIHAAIWLAPKTEMVPIAVDRSWLFGDVHRLATSMGVAAAAAFVCAGIAYLGQQDWWAIAALVGGLVSMVLMAVTFTPWWLIGLLLNAAVLVAAWQTAFQP
jgi:hypothetical protein